jgi:hypothetical protein
MAVIDLNLLEVADVDESAFSLAGLRDEEERLNDQLREAMNAGEIHSVIRIQEILASYPARIRAAKCGELRKELNDIESRLSELKAEESEIFEETQRRNQVLAELMAKTREQQKTVNDALVLRSILNLEKDGLIIRRKELNAELKSVIDAEVKNGFTEFK